MNSAPPTKCWATLMTGEKYLPGLAVFSKSLLRSPWASKYALVAMITPEAGEDLRQTITDLGCQLRVVNPLTPPPHQQSTELGFNHFGDVWAKLRAFDMVEYERVMVDSDMLVRRNMDELFDMPLESDEIAADFACTCNPAKISTYPAGLVSSEPLLSYDGLCIQTLTILSQRTPENCAFTPQRHPGALTHPTPLTDSSPRTHRLLNSGLVVLSPLRATMEAMEFAIATDPRVKEYRFPDQDFLADFFFGRWKPLPWFYNALKKLRMTHGDMWRDEEVRNVHYIINKPWSFVLRSDDPDNVTHSWWWDVYQAHRSSPIITKHVSEKLLRG